ncbi:MAG: DMT family transporter [Anaerolineae bacterium]|nr:DMT family transporter [Anaerolineae bacterium]
MSSASILVRWAQNEGVPSLVIAAYRLATATGILSFSMIQQRGWREYAKLDRQTIVLILMSGVLLGLHFAAWITSLTYTSVMNSVVLVTTTPLWIGLASPLFLGERIPRLMWLSLVVAMIGASIIGLSGLKSTQIQTLEGNGLALLGAMFGSGYLIVGRRLRTSVRLISYLWLVYGTAALLLLVWVVVNRLPLAGYSLAATICMLTLGIVPQLIGHGSANYAVRYLSATLVSITILGEPIGSTILAALLLEELPGSPLQILGGAFTLAGIASASLAEQQVNRQ